MADYFAETNLRLSEKLLDQQNTINKLRDGIKSIHYTIKKLDGTPHCRGCNRPWPCPTIQLVDKE